MTFRTDPPLPLTDEELTEIEGRAARAHILSKDCWCHPKVEYVPPATQRLDGCERGPGCCEE